MNMPSWLQTRRAKIVAASLAAALALGAGGLAVALNSSRVSTPPTQRVQPSSTPTPTVRPPAAAIAVAHSPLTGLPGKPVNRVIAVKVNNTEGQTQFGIGSADVVVEELVEGGLTRLIAMYQGDLPSRVGPVRSLRSTDSYLVLPVRGLLLSSGGSGLEVRDLNARKVDFRSEGAGYSHVSSRPSVFSVVVDTKSLRQPYSPVADLLTFGKPNLSKTKAVSNFTVHLSSTTVRFTYRGGIYVREPDLAQVRFPATNVLLLSTRVRTVFVDQHDAKVPEEVLAGTGQATLYTQGRVITGRWQKPSQTSSIKTTFAIPPGKTAIELVPANLP